MAGGLFFGVSATLPGNFGGGRSLAVAGLCSLGTDYLGPGFLRASSSVSKVWTFERREAMVASCYLNLRLMQRSM